MSLPPNPQARYSIPTTTHPPRKSVFKCLPEIHASRLAVSGSLRPKLGLLLLMVVILVSLCFLLIPLLSKINLSQSKSPRIHNLPLIDVFEELNQKASSTVLFSPRIILSSLALLSSSRPGVCEVLQNNTSSIRMGGRVFTGRDVVANNELSCPVNEIVKVRGKSLVDEWLKEDRFRDTHKNIHFENMPVDKNVVVTISSVKLRPSSPVKSILIKDLVGPSGSMKPLKFTQIEGQVRMATFPTYTLVLLDMFQDNLELCLLLPHSKSEHLGHISWEDFNLSEYGRTHAEILLPDMSLVSNISLTEPLSALGKLPADTIVYQHSSLLLLPEAATGDDMSNTEGGVVRLVFDHSFVLMVREVGTESPLMVGRVIFPR